MQFSREFNAKSPTAEPEHVVHFSADSIDLDTLVSESGSIFGWKERDLHVQGSRVSADHLSSIVSKLGT
jgi:hypothetical protein